MTRLNLFTQQEKNFKIRMAKKVLFFLLVEDRIFISNKLRWATITYWEYRTPFERQYHAIENKCCIYYKKDSKTGKENQGFCLINLESKLRDDRVKKILETVHDGIELTFFKSSKVVQLENKCSCNIYIACPSAYEEKRLFKSKVLKPKQKCIVYDAYEVPVQIKCKKNHVYELNTINISFGKYWGFDSKRKSIEMCPCWLNVSINKNCFLN